MQTVNFPSVNTKAISGLTRGIIRPIYACIHASVQPMDLLSLNIQASPTDLVAIIPRMIPGLFG
jgi:hypothetical protein